MLRFTRKLASFFPLGRSSGPKNAIRRTNRTNLGTPVRAPPRTKVAREFRDDLKLQCRHCKFVWRFDALSVVCPSEKTHNAIEHHNRATWMWNKQFALHHTQDLRLHEDPRTGRQMGHENCRSYNVEKRMMGLNTQYLSRKRGAMVLSRHVSGVGHWSQAWQTHFPYPG